MKNNSNKIGHKIENSIKYRKIRENLTEKEIDKMIDDTFPASDPPSTYWFIFLLTVNFSDSEFFYV